MAKKDKPEISIGEATMAPTEGRVGVEATREYHHSRMGFFRPGQRALVDAKDMEQLVADLGNDAPLTLVEFSPEEKAEIEKALKSEENKALGSPETK